MLRMKKKLFEAIVDLMTHISLQQPKARKSLTICWEYVKFLRAETMGGELVSTVITSYLPFGTRR